VREIDVPFMGRHIGAFGEVAQVAQVALVYHFRVVSHLDSVHFHRRAFIDKIEQGREGIAQTHTATTTVADVIDPLQFLVERRLIPEFGIILVQGVSGRRTEAAFSAVLSHGKVPDVVLGCGVSSYRPSPGAGDDRQG
jgi:hypothetical protein